MPRYADTTNYTEEEIILWQKITASQATVFYTAKGLPFTYTIKGCSGSASSTTLKWLISPDANKGEVISRSGRNSAVL